MAERFMRTLKEQCIYLHQFARLEEAERIGAFIARYNAEWLVERLGHRSPARAQAQTSEIRVRVPGDCHDSVRLEMQSGSTRHCNLGYVTRGFSFRDRIVVTTDGRAPGHS